MMKKLLRTRASNGDDRDLIRITDEGVDTDIRTLDEAHAVVSVLANKVRAFYAAAEERPCTHRLDEVGDE